jgi:hypothetical protein
MKTVLDVVMIVISQVKFDIHFSLFNFIEISDIGEHMNYETPEEFCDCKRSADNVWKMGYVDKKGHKITNW